MEKENKKEEKNQKNPFAKDKTKGLFKKEKSKRLREFLGEDEVDYSWRKKEKKCDCEDENCDCQTEEDDDCGCDDCGCN